MTKAQQIREAINHCENDIRKVLSEYAIERLNELQDETGMLVGGLQVYLHTAQTIAEIRPRVIGMNVEVNAELPE